MKNTTSSFTLIEILIVITIIVLLTGLSLATYNRFTQQKNLEKESQKLIDILHLARTKSASSDSSECLALAPDIPTLEDFSVVYIDTKNYQLSPNCSVGTPNKQNFVLEANVIIANSFPEIKFLKLAQGATPACFELSSGPNCRYIQVTSQGVISEGFTPCGGSCP